MYWDKDIFIVDLNDLTRTDDGPAVMSSDNCRQLIARGKIQRLRRGGGLDSGVLIDYASLPDRFKAKFVAKYGDPELLKIQQKMEYRIDHKAREWYFDESRGIPSNLAEKYTTNASVLRMLSDLSGGATALVMVTHSDVAASVCDRTLVLRDGVLVPRGGADAAAAR